MGTITATAAPAPPGGRLFISYGRGDDEPFVKRLVADLTSNGIPVWWDRQAMESRGRSFLQEIRDAIVAECDRVLFVVGPEAVASPWVSYEWEHALAYCKVVIPVVRMGDPANVPARLKDVGYHLLPAELALFHTPDFRDDAQYAAQLHELCRLLRGPATPPGALHGVPIETRHLVQRPAVMRRLHDELLRDVTRTVVVGAAQQSAALQGMGGIGKSVVAAAFARECRTRRAFFDGVFWLAFGLREGAMLDEARRLGRELGDGALAAIRDAADIEPQLARALGGRACLLVLDDLWRAEQALPFVRAASASRTRLLLTTRDLRLAQRLDATPCAVDLLEDDLARELFARAAGRSPAELPEAAVSIVRRCAGLPLALAVVGARLRAAGPGEWADVEAQMRRAQFGRLSIDFPDYAAYPHLLAALRVSHQALPSAAARSFTDLAIFDEDARIPESVLVHLWRNRRVDAAAVRERIRLLVERSLLTRDVDGSVWLHDLLRGYLLQRCRDAPAVRRRLLEAWRKACDGDWSRLEDDGFSHRHLARLMVECNADDDIDSLLAGAGAVRPAWVQMRLQRGQVLALREDLQTVERHAAARVRQALAADTPAAAIGLCVRAALMRASIGTVGGDMPAVLLARAVQEGLLGPRDAWEAALALPQRDAARLNRKCAVLAALRVEGGVAAADDPVRALQVIERAIEQAEIGEAYVAWSLWDLVRGCGPHWLDPIEQLVGRMRTDDARGVGRRHLALLRLQAGQPKRAEAAASGVPMTSGRGLVVSAMAQGADPASLPALRRLHDALDAEQRQIAAPGLAAALWRHGQRSESLALLRGPASASEWTQAVQRLAPELDAAAAHDLLPVAHGHAERSPECVAAVVALVLRLPADERAPALAALWQQWIVGRHDDRALGAQRALLAAWPAALWPEPALTRELGRLGVSADDQRRVLLAPGLWQCGRQRQVLDWFDRAMRREERSALPADLIRAVVPLASGSELADLAQRLDRLPDRHVREMASVPLIGRLAETGQGHAAWQRLVALENEYLREQALKTCAPHLRGSVLAQAVQVLSRIGDDAEAELLRTALAALDGSGRRLAQAIDAGALPATHYAAQLAGCLKAGQTSADGLADQLRTVHDNAVLAEALLTLDRVAPGGAPSALSEALLAIDRPQTLMQLADEAVPRLPALGAEWADPLRQRWRAVVEGWLTDRLDGHVPDALATASAWHAWCAGAASTVERLEPLRHKGNPFDAWFAAVLATVPFMPAAMRERWLVELQDLVDAEPDPYRPLIRGGDLARLPEGLYAAMKAALGRAEFNHVRSEAGDLAVRAASLGDLDFATKVAQRLEAERPDAAMSVHAALMRHHSDATRRVEHARAAARCAQRLTNIVNQASRRSDALAELVPALLHLEAAPLADVLVGCIGVLADAPRSEFLRDLAALAPLFQRLDPALGAIRVEVALENVRAWWP